MMKELVMRIRFCLAICVVWLVPVAAITPAQAHSQFERAEPAAGSTAAAPREVAIWFSRDIEAAFSRIEVHNAAGIAVHEGKSVRDPADRKKLSVSLKVLVPGTYKVFWRILSIDTHRAEGNYSFSVK